MVLFYPSANFEEEVFDKPYQFDISRSPNRHLTFGVGQHMCIGFRLARQELRVFLEEFFRSVSSLELLGDPEFGYYTQINAIQALPVKLTA